MGGEFTCSAAAADLARQFFRNCILLTAQKYQNADDFCAHKSRQKAPGCFPGPLNKKEKGKVSEKNKVCLMGESVGRFGEGEVNGRGCPVAHRGLCCRLVDY